MSINVEFLKKKKDNAQQLGSVVETMKSLAAVTLSQFEESVTALSDYSAIVERGLVAYLEGVPDTEREARKTRVRQPEAAKVSILFGTDLGMVGTFNESLLESVLESQEESSRITYYAVGERMAECITGSARECSKLYGTPYSRRSLKSIITSIINDLNQITSRRPQTNVTLCYNKLRDGSGYSPEVVKLLPLDEDWYRDYRSRPWSRRVVPEVIYNDRDILYSLTRQFLFVELFKAGAEAVMAENAARLHYMEQAQRKIEDMLEELTMEIRRTRQASINSELLEIVSAYEALREE